jgi:hypothetical protein
MFEHINLNFSKQKQITLKYVMLKLFETFNVILIYLLDYDRGVTVS